MYQPARFVFRALRPREEPLLGLRAAADDSAASVGLAEAIARGSGTGLSPFVHTSKLAVVAVYFAECHRSAGPGASTVVRIDLSQFNGQIWDVSTPALCGTTGLRGESYNFAVKHREIILQGYVPPRAIVKVCKTDALVLGRQKCSFDEFLRGLSRDTLITIATTMQEVPFRREDLQRFPMENLENMIMGRDPNGLTAIIELLPARPPFGSASAYSSAAEAEEVVALHCVKCDLTSEEDSLRKQQEGVGAKRRRVEERLQQIQVTIDKKLHQEQAAEAARAQKLQREQAAEAARAQAALQAAREQAQEEAMEEIERQRGQYIYACLGDATIQKKFLEQFDETTRCVALSQDGFGYVAVQQTGNCSWYGERPHAAEKLINKKWKQHKTFPVYLAFGEEERYFIQFENVFVGWSDGDDSFNEAMNDTTYSGNTVSVAFAPGGGWFISWDNGSYQWEGLPTSLHAKLAKWKKKQSGIPDFVSISPSGGWFVSWQDGDFDYEGISMDKRCAQTVDWISKKHSVRTVHFGTDDTWLIRYS